MATTWKAPTWRMPNEKNQSKFESYSLNFDGTNSNYITCGNNSSLSGPYTGYTISSWIKTPSSWENDYNAIFSKKYSFYLGLNTSHFLLLNPGTGSNWGTERISSYTFELDKWYHVAATADGTNVKLYINGELDYTIADTNTAQNSNTGHTPHLGSYDNAGDYDTWKGELNDVIFFDYALSSTQISLLYNSGSPINPMTLKPAPIAYYPLGGNASTGGDSTNTLSVPNVAVPDASVFNFDTSDFITTTTISEFGITGEFTVSMWLNSSTLNGYATPLWASDNSFASGFGFYYNSSRFHFFVDHYITYGVVQTGTSTTNVWYHLVGTFSSSGTVKLYINGEANGTPKTGATLDGLNNTLTISKGTAVAGDITNVQLWDKELIDSEVETLYNSGVPLLTGTQPQASNLKAWYKLNQLDSYWDIAGTGNWTISNEAIN